MAPLTFAVFAPSAAVLVAAVALDLAFGDPAYSAHPVRLIGRVLQIVERALRGIGADGYIGGILLFVVLASVFTAGISAIVWWLSLTGPWIGRAAHLYFLYSFLALGDLLRHGQKIEHAIRRNDLRAAKEGVSMLVGRDTGPMDGAACRRAAVESLSENLTDGFTSPLFWYIVGGLPLLVTFKVVSTMDSMVGYKTPRYARFGWCGARLDDAMNLVPARLTWLLVSAVAAVLPGCSGKKAWRIGLEQHAILPGPNSGWSEAATAGAIERRLVGPIWLNGRLVTDTWLGDPGDPPLGTEHDYETAKRLIAWSGVVATVVACVMSLVRQELSTR